MELYSSLEYTTRFTIVSMVEHILCAREGTYILLPVDGTIVLHITCKTQVQSPSLTTAVPVRVYGVCIAIESSGTCTMAIFNPELLLRAESTLSSTQRHDSITDVTPSSINIECTTALMMSFERGYK